MAREDATKVGLIGTGLQARTQLLAIVQVRKIERVRVFGRDPARRTKFSSEMAERLTMPVDAVDTAEAAVRDAHIVVTATTASQPVLNDSWLRPGVHINAIGANFPQKRELDAEAVKRSNVIVADSREQSKLEAGDLMQVFGEDAQRWTEVGELADLVSGKVAGRTKASEITLFKSNGIAIEDIVVAGRIFEMARERGIGRQIPMWQEAQGEKRVRTVG